MDVISLEFALFVIITFILYWIIPARSRWLVLLGASLYFYYTYSVNYLYILLAASAVTYLAARFLGRHQDKIADRAALAIAVAALAGVLVYFKYLNFIIENINQFAETVHQGKRLEVLNIVLPVGMSFYIFSAVSYLVDVYRKEEEPETNLGHFLLYMVYFPKLLAGPIERSKTFLKQINTPGKFQYNDGCLGMRRILWGCFQKIAIANVLAKYVNAVYSNLQGNSGVALLLASLFFTIQIYCDFSGYSDIAIGVSRLFGIRLMDNFHSPYFSVSVRDFWSRWHISLSTWLRDYIYIPLGGSRCSRGRNYLNLLITFLFSGLWHGASWTFIAWGGIHGLMQVLEKATLSRKKSAACVLWCRRLFVFLFVNFAWVFFRAASFADAWYLIRHVFTVTAFSDYCANTMGIMNIDLAAIAACVIILTVFDYFSLQKDIFVTMNNWKTPVRWMAYLILVWLILYMMPLAGSAPFIYSNF